MRISILMVLLCYTLPAVSQNQANNLLRGKWALIRVESPDRILDMEDTARMVQSLFQTFKRNNSITTISIADSLEAINNCRRNMQKMYAQRLRINFNADNSFSLTGALLDPEKTTTGTYIADTAKHEILLTSFDKAKKKNQTVIIPLIELAANKLIIKFPTRDPNIAEFRWILKKN